MTIGIDHVAIAAKDPQALADWYVEVLGFEVVSHNGQSPPTVLVGGPSGASIEIMPDNGRPIVEHGWADPGIRHLALRVENLDDARASLEAAGRREIRPGGEAMGGGTLWNFDDPEGNVLQIVERPGGFRTV